MSQKTQKKTKNDQYPDPNNVTGITQAHRDEAMELANNASELVISYIGLNVQKPPFDDPRVAGSYSRVLPAPGDDALAARTVLDLPEASEEPWVRDLDDDRGFPITDAAHHDVYPVFSPDGKTLLVAGHKAVDPPLLVGDDSVREAIEQERQRLWAFYRSAHYALTGETDLSAGRPGCSGPCRRNHEDDR